MTLKPEHIVEALNKTPELKRRLILRIMEELLDSEAFMEAYPRLYDPAAAEASPEYREKVREELAQIIVRLFHKNKVRPDDAEEALNRARGTYLEMYASGGRLRQAERRCRNTPVYYAGCTRSGGPVHESERRF